MIDAFKLVCSVSAEKKLIFLCLFLTLLSGLCLQAIHLGHRYSVFVISKDHPWPKSIFKFYVNKKEKKNELNGDVALVFKENGKCLKL